MDFDFDFALADPEFNVPYVVLAAVVFVVLVVALLVCAAPSRDDFEEMV